MPHCPALCTLPMMSPSGRLKVTPHQLLPPCAPGNTSVLAPTFHGLYGTVSASLFVSQRFWQKAWCSGVTFARSCCLNEFRDNGSGLIGNGCVADVHSPGTVVCGTGRSSTPKIGSPVSRL